MPWQGNHDLAVFMRIGCAVTVDMSNLILSLAGFAARLLPMSVKQRIYRVPWLSRLVRGGLNRAAPQGRTRVKVAAGALAGWQLDLDMQSEKDYWLGTYEPQLHAAIQELVKPGMTAYDIGANIGYISLLLAQIVGETGQVYAFEALPENIDRLRVNLTLNSMQDRVQVIAAAVVDRSGPVIFWVGPSGGMGKADGSLGRDNLPYTQSIPVEGIGLDDFVYRQHHPEPQLIKIDIEGGEVLALPGMQQLLSQARPLVFLELHGPEAARTAWEVFTTAGYRLCYLEPRYPAVTELQVLDWKTYLVAFPQSVDEGIREKSIDDGQHQ